MVLQFANASRSLPARRLAAALLRWPDRAEWWALAPLLLGFVVVSLPLALLSGLMGTSPQVASRGELFAVAVAPLFAPGLLEELLYRVCLNPHPDEHPALRARIGWAVASLTLFVASHPLAALLFRPAARPVFLDPLFLLIAALLGTTCLLAYLRTRSVWPAIFLHWLTVSTWLALGGRALLAGS